MTIKERFKKIIKFLNPVPNIGGLEISDSAIRFITLSGIRLKQAAINLAPGIVADGQVKNRAGLVAALKNLHWQIARSNKAVSVVVTGSSHNAYTQIFNIPATVENRSLEEAVKLNLEMISPFDIKSAYYDAQSLGESTGNQASFLGAFVNAAVVDQFTITLEEANFNVVAFEFPALSLSRLIKQLSEVDFYGSHLLLDLSSDGLNFLILAKGQLYFNYFLPWRAFKKGAQQEITLADLKEAVVRELKRLISFYGNRFGRPLDTIVLSFPKPLPELEKYVQENFPIKIQTPVLDSFPGLSPVWFPALGAALRGLIPRSQDKFISLTAVGTEEKYIRSKTLHFISVWRNVILTSLSFLLVLFLAVDVVLMRVSQTAEKELLGKLARPDIQEVDRLQKEAQEFNRLVNLAGSLEQKTPAWSPFFDRLNKLTDNSVSFERIYIDSQKRVTLNGRTASEATAISFKNKLSKEKYFDKVTLPLALMQTNADGSISFTLNLEIKSWEF